MLSTIAFALSLTGFALIALAMDRHGPQALKRPLSPAERRAAVPVGWGLLLLSAAPCVAAYDWSVGLTWWFGLLTLAAALLLLLFTYRPRAVPLVTLSMPAIVLLALANAA